MDGTHKIFLRSATQKDIPFLKSLRATTMQAVVSNHYAWDDTAQQERVMAHFDCAKIIEIDGEEAGLLKIVESEREIHLSQIQLSPKYQGKGIGSHLIKSMLEKAQRTGCSVNLNVFRCNPALSLYTRLGFSPIAEDAHFYTLQWTPTPKV